MVWLDLEGTLIDDLSNRKWLDKGNIIILGTKFGLFTWGWFDSSEIDWDLVHAIEERFSNKTCVKVITKKDCMDFMFNNKLWFFDGWNNISEKFELCLAEECFNEKFTKEECFIEMFKNEKQSWLFDDTIKDDKRITFLDNDNSIFLFKYNNTRN